jgi:hypothetical protein
MVAGDPSNWIAKTPQATFSNLQNMPIVFSAIYSKSAKTNTIRIKIRCPSQASAALQTPLCAASVVAFQNLEDVNVRI